MRGCIQANACSSTSLTHFSQVLALNAHWQLTVSNHWLGFSYVAVVVLFTIILGLYLVTPNRATCSIHVVLQIMLMLDTPFP